MLDDCTCGGRHPAFLSVSGERDDLRVEVERLKDKYESCEKCDGTTDAGVFCVPCWNRVNLQLRELASAWTELKAAEEANAPSGEFREDALRGERVRAAKGKLNRALDGITEKPKDEKGNCSECGALVERLYSLRCHACYDKLVAGMGKSLSENCSHIWINWKCDICGVAEKPKSEIGVFCLQHRKVMHDGVCPKCATEKLEDGS